MNFYSYLSLFFTSLTYIATHSQHQKKTNLILITDMIDDHNNTLTSPTNSTVLINSPTSILSNSSSAVLSSQSAHNLISSMNNNISNANNNNNNNQINSSSGGQLINNNSNNNQNGIIVSHSQSAHQLGLTLQQQTPHTPLAAHHQALQQQLQKHFANNHNMGK